MTITGDPPTDVSAPPPAGESTDGGGSDRLGAAVSKMRLRTGVPVDKWLQIAGTVLPLLGLVAIAGAWYGVSHTAREWRQTPYVVSGGLLGLGLIFLGGFTYFAFWLTKLVEQSHRQTATLERIEAALTGRSPESADADALVMLGGVAHRSDCALLAGRDDAQPFSEGSGATACPLCDPDMPTPPASKSSRGSTRRKRS